MAAPVPALNQQVSVRSCACTVRFVGKTAFADGTWIGVEFPTACGRNDGTVEGVRYFECAPRHGLFVRPAQVDPLSMAAARVEKPHPEAHRDAWAAMENVLEAEAIEAGLAGDRVLRHLENLHPKEGAAAAASSASSGPGSSREPGTPNRRGARRRRRKRERPCRSATASLVRPSRR